MANVEEAMLKRVIDDAAVVSERIALQLPPLIDADHGPVAFADRRDGVPCDNADCDYAFVLGVPVRNRARAQQRALEQLQARSTRYFVDLELDEACVMSCEDLADIDEQKLRLADPTAIAILRLLRDAGADVLLIRGILSARIAVVFKQSIGRRVRVVDEAAASSVGHQGAWVRDALEPARTQDRWRALIAQPRGSARRLRPTRMAWELAIALICFLLAPYIVDAAGREVTMPLWAELFAGVGFGGIGAAIAWRAAVPSRADFAHGLLQTYQQLERIEYRASVRGRELHRELLDLFSAYLGPERPQSSPSADTPAAPEQPGTAEPDLPANDNDDPLQDAD
jgi:hypothetical protein